MPRIDWKDVPEGARKAVEAETGPIRLVVATATGSNAALTVRLFLENGGQVFCKGTPLSGRTLWMYRNEVRFNEYLFDIAPALLWTVERDEWLLLGFDVATGESAQLHPGSPHLPRIATFLSETAHTLTPAPDLPTQRLADRWELTTWVHAYFDSQNDVPMDAWEKEHARELAQWEDVTPLVVGGTTLQHTDMTPNNFLVGERISLTDWSWPALAAPWVDTALLVHRLIAAGHTPQQAEEWATTVPEWSAADTEGVTALAVTVLGIWRNHNSRKPAPYRRQLANAARLWVEHRLG